MPEDIVFPEGYFEREYKLAFPDTEPYEIKIEEFTFIQATALGRFSPLAAFYESDSLPKTDEEAGEVGNYFYNRVKKEQDQWHDKKIQEQFAISGNGRTLNIYNYCKDFRLTDEMIEKIAQWFKLIEARTQDGLGQIDKVLIDDRSERLWTGEPVSGEYGQALGAIILSPEAFKNEDYRIEGVDKLSGTLTHEWAHQYFTGPESSSFYSNWAELGGWRITQEFSPKADPGGYKHQIEADMKPETCINKYATKVSSDDFAEHAVASLIKSEISQKASSEKHDFVVKNLFRPQPLSISGFRPKKIQKPTPPEFPKLFYFTMFIKESQL